MDLRCFIAISIHEQLQKKIGECIELLNKYETDIKWVTIKNLHLTLKFLGNTPDALLPKINESLIKVVSSFKPFYIKIYGTGLFPNRKYPRVIWVGVYDTDRMKNLQKEIEHSMTLLGFKKEDKEFNPHLTIGRVRSQVGMIRVINNLDLFREKEFGSLYVDRVLLTKSDLTPKGPEYTCLHDVPFGSNNS